MWAQTGFTASYLCDLGQGAELVDIKLAQFISAKQAE